MEASFTPPAQFTPMDPHDLEFETERVPLASILATWPVEVLIVTTTDREFAQAFTRLRPGEHRPVRSVCPQGSGVTYHLGRFGAFNAALINTSQQSGGQVSVPVEEALTKITEANQQGVKIQLVVNVGALAGFLPDEDQKIGQVIVASMLASAFVSGERQEGVTLSGTIRPGLNQRFMEVITNLSRSRDFRQTFNNVMGVTPRVSTGTVITVGLKLGDEKFRDQLMKENGTSGILGGDTVAWHVAYSAFQREIPWLVVKAISNWGDAGAKRLERQSESFASAAAAFFADKLLELHEDLKRNVQKPTSDAPIRDQVKHFVENQDGLRCPKCNNFTVHQPAGLNRLYDKKWCETCRWTYEVPIDQQSDVQQLAHHVRNTSEVKAIGQQLPPEVHAVLQEGEKALKGWLRF